MSGVEWTELRDVPADRWMSATLKGTNTAVDLVLLHHDASTGASCSLVRFPAGLTRDELGCYPAAEELAILDGSLDFAGHQFRPGDYAFVPPFGLRTPMASPDGLLVLAWFSGTPEWLTDPAVAGPSNVIRRPLTEGVLREPTADVPGTTVIVDKLEIADTDRDILDISTARWTFLPRGAMPPAGAGPFLARTWP